MDAQVAPTWQVMGPRVSGPRLDSWSGNPNALERPTFYTHLFHRFPPCGTMFPINLFFAGHVAASLALDAIASRKARRSRGLRST